MTKTRARVKTAASNYAVPEDIDEAADMVARIGDLTREIERIKLDMQEELAEVKARHEARAQPLIEERTALTEGVRLWAEANRKRLTMGGKVKYVRLTTGEIKWRQRPPAVTIRGTAQVLQRLKERGLTRFIRVKESVNKEAIREEPEAVAGIPGIKVGSAGEDFVVEPFFEGGLANND